jgi:hypothetical protein
MHVVVLDREVEQAKARWIAVRRAEQRETDRRKKVLTA